MARGYLTTPLRRRLIVTVPVLTPRLASLWVGFELNQHVSGGPGPLVKERP